MWIASTGKRTNVNTIAESGDKRFARITVSVTAIVLGADTESLEGSVLECLRKRTGILDLTT